MNSKKVQFTVSEEYIMKKILSALLMLLMLSSVLFGCSSGETSADPATQSPQPAEGALVSYLGPAGTYTEEAARFFFNGSQKFFPEATVPDAIAAVISGKSDYAVIPQENTLGGAVTGYVDALIAENNIYVVGEVILPISQTLMGVSGSTLEDIKVVVSHAQGIVQSREWREKNLPDAETLEMSSTAAAASYVAEKGDRTIAAVASPGAAELYSLTVLAENVQITDSNKTRFYVLAKERLEDSGFKNAVFVATCGADRLDDIIIEIHDAGLELVSLHDRPEGSRLGSYYYIIEAENASGINQKQIEKIESISEIRCLGSFSVFEKK